ncbi:MAG: tRNA preQ1(34) S-adenosylmethionine ribosyltransferase-isomerase QueA [Herpetosiphon sp.]
MKPASSQPQLQTTDFDYHLPPELIAQTPIEPRDAARMLVLDRAAGNLTHARIPDLLTLLRPGDLLVSNASRVLPARLWARKLTGGRVEILLLRERSPYCWEALLRGKGLEPGTSLEVPPPDAPTATATVTLTVSEILPSGGRLLQFDRPLRPLLPQLGTMPLPPYIHTPLTDPERYQTVYSETPGSAAAPTAGLHFTPQLLAALKERGVEWATVLLHVGIDTFRPVHVDQIVDHQMHSEFFSLPASTADAINRARAEQRRVVAVGTTTVRVLETVGRDLENAATPLVPASGDTDIFIYPPYHFRVVDGLLTNFHLPKSTLMMLVSAFAGTAPVLQAYRAAVQHRYRFFSFGDAMLIL